MSKNRSSATGASVFPTAVFTRFGHRKRLPLREVKVAILWENVDRERNVLETVTAILDE
jgi:hypothetical protein